MAKLAAESNIRHSGRKPTGKARILSNWEPIGKVFILSCMYFDLANVDCRVQGLVSKGGPENPIWTLVSFDVLFFLFGIITSKTGQEVESQE